MKRVGNPTLCVCKTENGGSLVLAKERIKDVVTEIAQPLVESLDLELVEVEWVREGKDWYLRFYIYKKDGVSMDDCVAVNKLLSDELDRLDPIKDQYILEVSSPGIDRPFRNDRDFERYAGDDVEVQLFKAEEGIKKYEGRLVGLIEGQVVIFDGKNDRAFLKGSVATVKRTIKF